MTDKEIILDYLKENNINKSSFYNKTGLSNGFLDSGKSIGVDKLRIILDNYPDEKLLKRILKTEFASDFNNIHSKIGSITGNVAISHNDIRKLLNEKKKVRKLIKN